MLADEPQPALFLAEVVGRPEAEVEQELAQLAFGTSPRNAESNSAGLIPDGGFYTAHRAAS